MEQIYEIVGIKGDNIRVYQSGTIKQIEENELLDNDGKVSHETIDDIIRDMDCFSDYKHYYRKVG